MNVQSELARQGYVKATAATHANRSSPSEVLALLNRLLRSRPAWQADALCREYPDVSFFPRAGQRSEPAKAVCRRCAVAEECRAFVMEMPPDEQEHGIWAGTTGKERTVARREQASEAKAS